MLRPHRTDGFTIIEILVVVIIIGILAAIAIPMYLQQRERAKDAAVQEGVHGIQVGVHALAVRMDGQFPPEAEVTVDGEVGKDISDWPDDPFGGGPMLDEGPRPGNFDYEVAADGLSYTLTQYLSGGDVVIN